MAKKKVIRKNTTTKKKKISLGKISLFLGIITVLGYGALLFFEGGLLDNATPAAKPSKPNLEVFDLYFTKAFDFAWPAYATEETIIERPYYTLRYSEEHEMALWVAYQLSSDSLAKEKFPGKGDYRKDPRIKTGSAESSDYKKSGFDRGHLAPAADFSYSEFALSSTFYMSNISPQVPAFNQGIWKKLEEQVRDWADEHHTLYVVTGPVFDKPYKTIGKNDVSVPEYFYKVILDIKKPGIKAIAFLIKNEGSEEALETFAVTIDTLEKLTGLDFFPAISDELEEILEKELFTAQWF